MKQLAVIGVKNKRQTLAPIFPTKKAPSELVLPGLSLSRRLIHQIEDAVIGNAGVLTKPHLAGTAIAKTLTAIAGDLGGQGRTRLYSDQSICTLPILKGLLILTLRATKGQLPVSCRDHGKGAPEK